MSSPKAKGPAKAKKKATPTKTPTPAVQGLSKESKKASAPTPTDTKASAPSPNAKADDANAKFAAIGAVHELAEDEGKKRPTHQRRVSWGEMPKHRRGVSPLPEASGNSPSWYSFFLCA
mmetsp:Transcript_14194/g.37291  ORF Transcript_14194/g.37291 Transcript_14194/m.37291 type:complete len:119 (+) Transcript_14194:304-660(+)